MPEMLFDPSGRGYDYETAKKAGMRPQVQEDGKPHWGSVAPIDEKLGIYRVLKGRQHPTFDKAVEGEKQRNAAVVRGKGGFYYSIPEPFGFNIRTKLFPSEEEYFTKNQNVTGMAAEDGKIILNPNTDLSPQELLSVSQNEAARLFMMQQDIVPGFDVTDEQMEYFSGTPYEGNLDAIKQSIVGRVISQDPSILPTDDQEVFSKMLLRVLSDR